MVNISDEAQYLNKCYTAEMMETAHHFGWNNDGTSKNRKKILENSVTLCTGQVLPTGYHPAARETSETITAGVKAELAELSAILRNKDIDSTTVNHALLEKLSFFMTDRASNEKLSNKQLIAWIQAEVGDTSNTVAALYCMAHVLLGFQRYTVDEVSKLQKDIIQKDNVKLGRDSHVMFRFYSFENVASRIVRMCSQVFGPNGDEKCGVRDKWLADCHRRRVTSYISNYKDNRFNSIFLGATELIHHLQDMIRVDLYCETLNLKLQSIILDLKDSRVITFVQAFAMFYVQLTEPYWRVIQSVTYDRLPEYVQSLASNVSQIIYDPEQLLNENLCIFVDFKPNMTHPLHSSAMTIIHRDRYELLLSAITAIATGIRHTIDNQLSEFLEGNFNYTNIFHCN